MCQPIEELNMNVLFHFWVPGNMAADEFRLTLVRSPEAEAHLAQLDLLFRDF